jgi:DNA polymerase II small subunit/DNA polymerase delta subunit B
MKEQIVKRFLKEGVLLTPEALGRITENNLDATLERAAASKPAVFSFHEEDRPEHSGPSVEVRKLQKRLKLQPQDFTKYYNARFGGLRDILQKKMEGVVSVANARKSGSPAATIGMVGEQTQRGFLIEDTTGSMEVISRSEDVRADDVIGVKGGVKEEKLFAEEIIWPDVPMSRSHSRPEMSVMLSEKDGHKGIVVATPEAVFDHEKKRTALPSPGWITISRGGVSATLLVYRPEKPVAQKEAAAWLRRRHLCPGRNQIRGTEDPFLIEPIPDILWIVQADKWNESYKGVMIVSSDGKVPVRVDLASGNVEPGNDKDI